MCVCWCVYIHTQFLAVYREMGFIAKHLPNKKKKANNSTRVHCANHLAFKNTFDVHKMQL